MNITPLIDYQKIADAHKYYSSFGFTEIPVPWIISHKAYSATNPHTCREFHTLDGYLNASGEQSFIDLLLSGKKLTKHQTTTACFRDDEINDIHYKYFIKLELIDMDVSLKNLEYIISLSQNFLNQYLETKVIETNTNTYDIVDAQNEIELGSYGIREFKEWKWIYATGIALPRLDVAITKQNYV